MTTKLAPKVRLNDGTEMPVLGLGTWKSKRGEVEQAVRDAIDAGYRHIDCALLYENEEEVGNAIRAKIAEGLVKREDLFITSKLWNNFHKPDLVEGACKLSLSKLGLDYLDLYLIHWPVAFKEGLEFVPVDANGKTLFSTVDYVDTWKAMEKLVEKKLTRSIGVSNFNSVQLKRVLENAKIKPAVNQIECHPYLNQQKLVALCKQHNVLVTAYSPFGSPDRPWADQDEKRVFDDEVIIAIAKKHKKTAGQVVLRYLIQRGTVPIPKSVTKSRIQENINVFDFELTKEDMAAIDGVNKNRRACPLTEAIGHPDYPFNIEY